MRMPSTFHAGRIPAAAATSLALVVATAGCFSSASGGGDAEAGSLAKAAKLDGLSVTVGSKEFTEQLILCHITSIALRSAGATAREKCGLSGSNTVRAALTSGSIDMYWEYTGTAWINHLKNTKPIGDPAKQYEAAAQQDLSKNRIKWLTPAPANNTYAVGVKTDAAQRLGVKSLSDYAKLVRSDPAKGSMCVASEFAGRSDGWPGLQKAYGFNVSKSNLATLAEGAIFNAVAKGKPCAFGQITTTDGRIKALKVTPLTDDKKFFPIYNPAITVRESVYKDNAGLEKVTTPIAQALTDSVLQDLNGEVDIQGKDPTKVAEAWLQSKGFIGK